MKRIYEFPEIEIIKLHETEDVIRTSTLSNGGTTFTPSGVEIEGDF